MMDFDADFASPADWARYYRKMGLQLVPSYMPSERPADWKRPIIKWREFETTKVPDTLFEQWYGLQGEHRLRPNMGIICGAASDRVFVIDLDTHKTDAALNWWTGLLAVHNNGMALETPRQTTGGGGKQMLFRAPDGWISPTCRTSIGVDIRGQGGFAVLAPSRHASGNFYTWDIGPWDADIADAPQWLCEAIDSLVEEHGGTRGIVAQPRVQTASTADYDAFGNQVDGREDYMTRVVWGAVLDLRREAPMKPQGAASDAAMLAAYNVYVGKVRTRLPLENEIGLETERRGLSLFQKKWEDALKQWDGKVTEEAAKPKPVPLDEPTQRAHEQEERAAGASGLILTGEEFVSRFKPPEYLIDGIMQRGYLYSLTARTGHGKTAVALYLCQAIARGLPAHGRKVKPGTVIFCAGENADDIRARWIVLADKMGFDIATTPVRFIDGVIDIKASTPRIIAEADAVGDVVLIVVDTAAAYFNGDDANSNTQQVAFARDLRVLTASIVARPAVVVNCHPVKNAARDNLIPMGGSALVNEVDGNLTLWSGGDGQTTLHWYYKHRGPEFEPLTFKMETAHSKRVVDSDGREMPSVVASPMGEIEQVFAEREAETDENVLLAVIGHNKGASIADMARKAGWVSASGVPAKSKVFRVAERLLEAKLVKRFRNSKYAITESGKDELGWNDDRND